MPLDSSRIKHKELRKLFEGKRCRIQPQWIDKTQRILASLNIIVSPRELTIYKCHELQGNRKGTYSLHLTANQRITFRWDEAGPFDVDLEDYHGK